MDEKDLPQSEPTLPTGNERILAVLAHLAALAHGLGLPLPALLWAEQRKDSRYVAFQTLQAYGYQSLGYTVWILFSLGLAMLGLFALILVNAFAALGEDSVSIVFFFFGVIVFALFGLYNLLAIVAAAACAFGRDFRYPLLGARLAKYIADTPVSVDASPDHINEERFAVAMGHFAVIFPFYGLLGPLGLWLTAGKRSVFIRAQSSQTVIYQAVGSVLYTVSHLLPIILIFPVFLGLFSFGHGWEAELFNPFTVGLAFFGMCMLSIAVLLGPLYHILGQWAGLQVLLGRDFQYPLVGRIAGRWAKRESVKSV
jgi:uncharacterized Tic20 family protein